MFAKGIAASILLVFAGCRPAISDDAKQVREGRRVRDPHLEAILAPEEPVVDAGLYRSADGRFYYEAHLKEAPVRGFLDRYEELLNSRSALIEPLGSSPHAIPQRVMGWQATFRRPGRKSPLTYFWTVFVNKDEAAIKKLWPWNAPNPFRLDGTVLRVQLGQLRDPWQEAVLVPDEDQVRVRELPFARYPGAVLLAPTPIDDRGLTLDKGVSRVYLARADSFSEVLAHYERALRRIGINVEPATAEHPALRWSGDAVEGIVRVSVSKISPFIFGRDPQEAVLLWPQLLEGYPIDLVRIHVSVFFAHNTAASIYWPERDRERRVESMKGH